MPLGGRTLVMEFFKSTPFYKDCTNDGILNASHKGIEREYIKLKIQLLFSEFKTTKDKLKVLEKYDEFTNKMKNKELVLEKKNILEKLINDDINTTFSISEISEPVNITDSYDEIQLLNIYILSDGTYFIGNKNNSIPAQPIKTIATKSKLEEDLHVKEYMLKYGIEKVRGGSYVGELDINQYLTLQRELMYAERKQVICENSFDNNLNSSYITTFLLHNYCKLSIEKISYLRSFKIHTIEEHLKKCKQFNVIIKTME